MIRVGVADDEDLVREGIAALLSAQPGMIVVATVAGAQESVEPAVSGAIDVLLLDIHLGERGGLDALEQITSNGVATRVLMVSGYSEEEYAVGRGVTEVAAEFNLSVSSVSTYRQRILDKMDLTGTAAIIRYAVTRQLV